MLNLFGIHAVQTEDEYQYTTNLLIEGCTDK